jgi:hypothetical protein
MNQREQKRIAIFLVGLFFIHKHASSIPDTGPGNLDGRTSPIYVENVYSFTNGNIVRGKVYFSSGINVPSDATILMEDSEVRGAIILNQTGGIKITKALTLAPRGGLDGGRLINSNGPDSQVVVNFESNFYLTSALQLIGGTNARESILVDFKGNTIPISSDPNDFTGKGWTTAPGFNLKIYNTVFANGHIKGLRDKSLYTYFPQVNDTPGIRMANDPNINNQVFFSIAYQQLEFSNMHLHLDGNFTLSNFGPGDSFSGDGSILWSGSNSIENSYPANIPGGKQFFNFRMFKVGCLARNPGIAIESSQILFDDHVRFILGGSIPFGDPSSLVFTFNNSNLAFDTSLTLSGHTMNLQNNVFFESRTSKQKNIHLGDGTLLIRDVSLNLYPDAILTLSNVKLFDDNKTV